MRPMTVALALLTLASGSRADVIHACVAKPNGKIRIVASADMCKTSETAVDWDQSGPPNGPFKFVGFTTATVSGNAGVLEWTRACGAESSGTRACKSDEIVFSAAPPQITNPDDQAWVIPVLIAPNTDVSGFQNSGVCAVLGGAAGLTVDGHGRYNNAACTEAHRVACCAPGN